MKHILMRSIRVGILFGILFFVLNYFADSNHNMPRLIGLSLLATLTFMVLNFIVFWSLRDERTKIKFGITIPIAILIGLILGGLILQSIKVGLVAGVILGIIAGVVWVLLDKRNVNK
ncbi:hypothetical protein [Staphylococcus massiliensis]|uniref:Permease n=1 Tax=Staphylococcus massiliensis S46 TaxID=1229783 RepID=K9B5G1_9STAP|nr:hypothetical protein [Staphylococcus massiliensis]EKU48995.1 hypothetical protein C273_04300 [Staphylococcus massiliensis S46]MCG3399436.1 hypothetical protein [Staphylococcus massiliensis]MCG3402464.1 hypothetical protein [Staphylococcus massiliensis]MCG3411572.1 hypothetical protein [Staphylococcus massiliensis]PNZ99470.1 hypothetical protein CD133_06180 [Staphylococcus massiliensis CCUG 55927]